MKNHPPRSQKGFTLIELIQLIAIVAIVVVLIFLFFVSWKWLVLIIISIICCFMSRTLATAVLIIGAIYILFGDAINHNKQQSTSMSSSAFEYHIS